MKKIVYAIFFLMLVGIIQNVFAQDESDAERIALEKIGNPENCVVNFVDIKVDNQYMTMFYVSITYVAPSGAKLNRLIPVKYNKRTEQWSY